MELNNTIAKPLYKQLEDQLKEEIDTGKRKAGSRLHGVVNLLLLTDPQVVCIVVWQLYCLIP